MRLCVRIRMALLLWKDMVSPVEIWKEMSLGLMVWLFKTRHGLIFLYNLM